MRMFVRLCRGYKVGAYYEKYASYNPSPLSLKKLMDFASKSGAKQASFHFLRQEMPVRLANIMKEISLLPDKLHHTPSVSLVMNWYEQSFMELVKFTDNKNPSEETLNQFTDILAHVRNRHSSVVETMAQGIQELKEMGGLDAKTDTYIQYFLDRFCMSRISIHMLINQHTLLFGKHLETYPSRVGCIDPKCSVQNLVHDSYENAKFLCEQYYLTAPDLRLKFVNSGTAEQGEGNDDVQIVYVPSHLYHMLFELFKNALRATVEHYPEERDIPPVTVMVSRGDEDITIKLSDVGGGIPRSKMELMFRYMYTTVPERPRSDSMSAPLAGYGYGLPVSRLYARYFQGDLMLSSLEGYGTDAYIYLKVLSDEANELLPVYNRFVSKMYSTSKPVHDWSSATQKWSPAHATRKR